MDNTRKAYLRAYRKQYQSQTHRINLTLSKAEYREFSKAAGGHKLTPFVKRMALSGLRNRPEIPPDLNDELKTLRFAILNIANNVNQIAHHSNTVSHLTTLEENNLLQYLKQLNDVVKAYTENRILQQEHDH